METQVLTLAEAGAALDEIERKKSQLSAIQAEVGLRLEQAENGLGEAVLAGDEDAVRNVADIRLRADGLSAALVTLENRRAAALVDQRRATAADLRQQAEAKRAELAALEVKTAKLLAELSALENVPFTVSILSSECKGSWYPKTGGLQAPEAHLGCWECFADPVNPEMFHTPRSRFLRVEIADLEAKAGKIETELGAAAPRA
jgi:hypothetical protein